LKGLPRGEALKRPKRKEGEGNPGEEKSNLCRKKGNSVELEGKLQDSSPEKGTQQEKKKRFSSRKEKKKKTRYQEEHQPCHSRDSTLGGGGELSSGAIINAGERGRHEGRSTQREAHPNGSNPGK